jgi:hypothetical protein
VGVLPGGVALQVRQQALHAVNGGVAQADAAKGQPAGGRAHTDHAMRALA